jgi:hypothetical protein
VTSLYDKDRRGCQPNNILIPTINLQRVWVIYPIAPLVEKRLLVAHQFELCLAHMVCATIATSLVQIYSWRISICATHSLPFNGAYPICATSHKKYAPLRFENSKKLKIKKNNFFFENYKNRNNVKKLLYFNFLRILSHEKHF